MDALFDFLKSVFSKAIIVIPTLMTILGSFGGITIYRFAALITNLKMLIVRIDKNESRITALEKALEDSQQETKKAFEQRDEAMSLLASSTINIRTKKEVSSIINKFNKKADIEISTSSVEMTMEKPKKRVKFRKVGGVSEVH